jgi:hypothetical protein
MCLRNGIRKSSSSFPQGIHSLEGKCCVLSVQSHNGHRTAAGDQDRKCFLVVIAFLEDDRTVLGKH